jgi:hypothetical protein
MGKDAWFQTALLGAWPPVRNSPDQPVSRPQVARLMPGAFLPTTTRRIRANSTLFDLIRLPSNTTKEKSPLATWY